MLGVPPAALLWFFYFLNGALVRVVHQVIGRALTFKKRLILGTLIAYGVALAVQVTTMPTVAIELETASEARAATRTETRTSAEKRVDEHAHVTQEQSTEAAVRRYFSDVPIMAEVARCESRFNHLNPTTGTVLRGIVNNSDVGVMQINTYYHGDTARILDLDLHDFEDNMAYARYLYEREGTQPWSASRGCWGSHHLAMR